MLHSIKKETARYKKEGGNRRKGFLLLIEHNKFHKEKQKADCIKKIKNRTFKKTIRKEKPIHLVSLFLLRL